MNDLLIAHLSFTLLQEALRDLERCLAKEGLIIAPNKTQLCPPFKYLGHTIVDNIVKPPKLKLDIKEAVTLHELQTLL
jgi:predicted rRNA methylase YqxC with S4 and FtsJ domains